MDSDSDNVQGNDSTSEEFARFMAEKKLPDGENPLICWKMNEHHFPRLSLLVKNVLCVPATSVPCERLFSSSGYIVNKKRSSLDPHTVNMLVCLRDGVADWARFKTTALDDFQQHVTVVKLRGNFKIALLLALDNLSY